MSQYEVLGISGSLRKGATNTRLVHEASRLFGDARFQMGDLRLPLYDGDLESAHGIPGPVQKLFDQIVSADAVIISTPEYNKSISGVLKNALDWVSRVKGSAWRDKPVALMSAAAGRSGGERAQYALRLCMVPFRPRTIPGPEVMVASSGRAFDSEGRLIDERTIANLSELMQSLRAEISR